jgi:hypothetical protein
MNSASKEKESWYDLLLPAGVIGSHRSRTRFKYLDSSLAGHNNAKSRRGTKAFLRSCQNYVDSPFIHLDFFACYGAYSIHHNLIYRSKCQCFLSINKKCNTKVSGETLLTVSAIAFASESTANRNKSLSRLQNKDYPLGTYPLRCPHV